MTRGRRAEPAVSDAELELRILRARKLIFKLSRNLEESITDFGRGITIFRADLGALALDEPESKLYADVRDKLAEAASRRVKLSRASVDLYLQEAILQTLDVAKARLDVPFEARLTGALDALRKALTVPPRLHRVMIPLEGCEAPETPHSFGGVRVVSAAVAEKFVAWRTIQEPMRAALSDGFAASSRLVQSVSAGDSTFARSAALETAIEVVDVLNFFADLVTAKWKRPRVAIKGSVATDRNPVASLIDTTVTTSGLAGGWGRMSVPARTDAYARYVGYWKASALLKKPRGERNEFAARLLAAMGAAGRASVASRPGDSVLGFVISLDAALGTGSSTGTKIASRAAAILGGTDTERLAARKRVSALYKLRSDIVHDARTDVLAEDVADARWYAKSVIVALLRDKRFKRFRSDSEFQAWLEAAVPVTGLVPCPTCGRGSQRLTPPP